MIPEALDEACRQRRHPGGLPAALRHQPDRDADERRNAPGCVAEVARRHDIAIIENDMLGPLCR
jgi:hypothetical protein